MRAPLLLAGFLGLATAPAALAQGSFAPVEPASPNAEGIRSSYLFVSIFVLAIFVLVEALLVVFVWRYRRRRRGRFEEGAQVHGQTRLEILWTLLPVLVLFLIAVFVFVELPGIKNVPEADARGELEIRVTGRQYYWEYTYPNGVVAVDVMRAPAGVPVRLQVSAPDSDVIHSWWIPALGGKIDAIPGHVNETWFRADRPGVYEGQCAELCGIGHALMVARVEILPPDAFSSWLEERRAAQRTGDVALGRETWEGVCAKCHGLAGEGGLYRPIAGSQVLRDPEAIDTLVRNGRRTMPAVGAGWSAEQVDALNAYLRESPPGGS